LIKKILISLFVIGCILPLSASLTYALLYSLGLTGLLSDGLTLANWIKIFTGEFFHSMIYSVWIAFCSAFFTITFALTLLFIARNYLNRPNVYRSLFLPLTIPPIVLAFVIFQLYSGGGILSRIAWHLGLISDLNQFPSLVQDPYGIGIILAHIFLVFPFFLLVLLNLYENEKLDELASVASTLGAGSADIIFRVQVPVLLKGIFPLLALYFIFFLGAYEIPLVLGQSSPHMITVLILEKLQRFNLADIPVAYAMAVWYSIICIATISYLFTHFKKRYSL
jgi:putative spermidine/putrescine transport system permease protein